MPQKPDLEQINHLVEQHFDALAPTYEPKAANRRAYLEGIDRRIIAYLQTQGTPLTILDVGCGTGRRSAGLKAQLPASRLFGCDLSANMLNAALDSNLNGISRQPMTDLSWTSDTFDAVFCLFNSFGYLPTPAQRSRALSEFARVLKKGGSLLIDVMNRWHLGEGVHFHRSFGRAVWEAFQARLGPGTGAGNKFFQIEVDGQSVPGFVHGFTNGEMRKLLREAGLEVVHFAIVGYDTGETRRRITQGQLFYIARKPR